jgi:hypothetical protein
MNATRHAKASIGFAGGQVLAVRVTLAALEQLGERLAGERGWFELEVEDGSVRLDLAQVAYVRVDSDEPRVGFGT